MDVSNDRKIFKKIETYVDHAFSKAIARGAMVLLVPTLVYFINNYMDTLQNTIKELVNTQQFLIENQQTLNYKYNFLNYRLERVEEWTSKNGAAQSFPLSQED